MATGEQPAPTDASNVGRGDAPSASETTGADQGPLEPATAAEPRPTAHEEAVAAPATPTAVVHKARGRHRVLLAILALLVVAGGLGLATGMLLVRRGRSLGSDSSTAEVVVRPTFVISAPASPVVAGASPSAVDVAQSGPVPAPTPAASTTSYTVQPGDTLRLIAQKVYGDANQWPRLYEANREVIGANPDNLQAGMQLTVP